MAAGDTANFIVSAWTLDAPSTNVVVSASAAPASYAGSPTFTICPTPSGATCQLGSLAVGQASELLVAVPVDASAPPTTQIQLTADVSGDGAGSDSGTAADTVVAQGSAATVTPSDVTPPLQLLPVPGTSVSPISPAQLFPTVGPSQGAKPLGLPPAGPVTAIHASDVSATVPFDPRMIGAQLAGLAVLVAAVTIAVLRLSVRVRQPAAVQPRGIQAAGNGAAEPPSQP